MRRLFCVLAIFGLMLAMGSPARADSISFDLSTIANDLGGGTTPAADLVLVTVTTGVLGDELSGRDFYHDLRRGRIRTGYG